MQIKTILVATDFSSDADAAIEMAIEFALAFDSKLELFHAYHVEIPPIYAGFGGDFTRPADILEPIREGAEATMNKLVEEVAARGLDVRGRVAMDYASRAILDEAERLLADLIVMGTRGLSGLDHLVLGSTAERVIRLAHCPVMTVKTKS
jgi:nucleotide-binding universal stress UspA family protein